MPAIFKDEDFEKYPDDSSASSESSNDVENQTLQFCE